MLELRTLPLESLTPAAYNPRRRPKPTDPAYTKLRASLEAFGLVEPLVWNELTGRVVGGHLRLTILKELGFTEVPVSVVRLSEGRERALNVVLNNQEAQGRYDPGKLADLLEGLRGLPELALTGFGPATLAALKLAPQGTPAQETTGRVEVTFDLSPEEYDAVRADLDAFAADHDLAAHVRRA